MRTLSVYNYRSGVHRLIVAFANLALLLAAGIALLETWRLLTGAP